jgi:stage III sporulation protein AG
MMEERGRKKPLGVVGYLKSRGRLWLLVVGIVAGALLLLLGGMGASESAASAVQAEETERSAAELVAYTSALEAELETLCESVSGVSHVQVMVTLGSGYRTVYVVDGKGQVVTTGNGSSEAPVCRTLQPPVVEGVGIVCRGGRDPAVQRTLTELISTALNIPSNRVYITGK